MSVQQIPLVVSWIAAIDPRSETDQIGLATRMTRELSDASELGITEYYIGYFEQMPTFFMVGFPVEGHSYEISTLLVSPLIEGKLHLPLYHQVVQFIFKKDSVDRVIYQVESYNELLKSILTSLGFRDFGSAAATPTRIWYGCHRAEFLTT
jgi:hypothetical protein